MRHAETNVCSLVAGIAGGWVHLHSGTLGSWFAPASTAELDIVHGQHSVAVALGLLIHWPLVTEL